MSLQNSTNRRGGLEWLAGETASASSEILLDNVFSSDYVNYVLVISNLVLATDGVAIRYQLRTSAPANVTSTYRWARTYVGMNGTSSGSTENQNATTGWYPSASAAGNAANEQSSHRVTLYDPEAAAWKHMTYDMYWENTSGQMYTVTGGGVCQSTATCAGIRVYASSGNITSGEFDIYGERAA